MLERARISGASEPTGVAVLFMHLFENIKGTRPRRRTIPVLLCEIHWINPVARRDIVCLHSQSHRVNPIGQVPHTVRELRQIYTTYVKTVYVCKRDFPSPSTIVPFSVRLFEA